MISIMDRNEWGALSEEERIELLGKTSFSTKYASYSYCMLTYPLLEAVSNEYFIKYSNIEIEDNILYVDTDNKTIRIKLDEDLNDRVINIAIYRKPDGDGLGEPLGEFDYNDTAE